MSWPLASNKHSSGGALFPLRVTCADACERIERLLGVHVERG
jgi:hypothetical protein